MGQQVVIRSLPQAFEVMEEMGLSAEGWEADYRVASREALKGILEGIRSWETSSLVSRGDAVKKDLQCTHHASSFKRVVGGAHRRPLGKGF